MAATYLVKRAAATGRTRKTLPRSDVEQRMRRTVFLGRPALVRTYVVAEAGESLDAFRRTGTGPHPIHVHPLIARLEPAKCLQCLCVVFQSRCHVVGDRDALVSDHCPIPPSAGCAFGSCPAPSWCSCWPGSASVPALSREVVPFCTRSSALGRHRPTLRSLVVAAERSQHLRPRPECIRVALQAPDGENSVQVGQSDGRTA